MTTRGLFIGAGQGSCPNLARARSYAIGLTLVATLSLPGSPAAQSTRGGSVKEFGILTKAKMYDLACNVLDSHGRSAFRRAVLQWISLISADDAKKAEIRHYWEDAAPRPDFSCAGEFYLTYPLWTFRDAKEIEPLRTFDALSRAKDFELTCSQLSVKGRRAFFEAGFSWIGKSSADTQRKREMYAMWASEKPSTHVDCNDASLDLDAFFTTWTFQLI